VTTGRSLRSFLLPQRAAFFAINKLTPRPVPKFVLRPLNEKGSRQFVLLGILSHKSKMSSIYPLDYAKSI
jgi:hypothetical protein